MVIISSYPKAILKSIIIFSVFLFWFHAAAAQKQLLVMNRQRVLLRLYPGDEIVLKVKGNKQVRTSYVNNIFEDAVMIHRDTIPFHKIDKIYFSQTKFYNKLGGALVAGGAALFLIDQFNVVVVQGESPSLDSWVSTVSISSIGLGLPLMLIKKKSQRINGRYRLMMVKEGSSFYVPRPERSLYIDQ
jgi:hypothetical protein